MKILMLNYEFPPIGGGAANANFYLLKEYSHTKDLTVDVLTSAPTPGFIVEKFSENITIYKVGIHKKNLHYWRKPEVIEWLIKAWFHYRRLVKANKYDLVHAFFAFPSGLFCYLSEKKLPYIISLRGSDVPGYNARLTLDYKLLSQLFAGIWKKASLVVANSRGLRDLANKFISDLDIKIIPNGIDTKKFHPPEKRVLKKPAKLLTVGRLVGRKRIDLLIEVVGRAMRIGLPVHFTIAGSGNLLKPLQKLVQGLNIGKHVSFASRVPPDQMPQLYRDNDIFIMSSAHEGMSNAMLEAMASGLPIITTRCEGVDELIDENGIIAERATPDCIAESIPQISQNQQSYVSMSIASRKRAATFTWPAVASQYLNYYRQVLQTTKPLVFKESICAE